MKKQQGFAVLEIILTVIVLVAIGFTGWYVWHAKQNADGSLSDTANSQPAITKATKKSQPIAKSNSSGSADTKYLIVKEWGVKFPYSGSDTLTYKLSNAEAITVISANLAKRYPGCETYGAGNIGRGEAGDSVDESGQTLGEQYQANPSEIGKFNQYYYSFGHDQAACADNPTDASTAAQSAANDLVKAAVPKVMDGTP